MLDELNKARSGRSLHRVPELLRSQGREPDSAQLISLPCSVLDTISGSHVAEPRPNSSVGLRALPVQGSFPPLQHCSIPRLSPHHLPASPQIG